jgi:hypothetical protein
MLPVIASKARQSHFVMYILSRDCFVLRNDGTVHVILFTTIHALSVHNVRYRILPFLKLDTHQHHLITTDQRGVPVTASFTGQLVG